MLPNLTFWHLSTKLDLVSSNNAKGVLDASELDSQQKACCPGRLTSKEMLSTQVYLKSHLPCCSSSISQKKNKVSLGQREHKKDQDSLLCLFTNSPGKRESGSHFLLQEFFFTFFYMKGLLDKTPKESLKPG